MAKSIRSKWKRKCRAIKRVRYGKKEEERLKKTLGVDDSQSGSKDVNMTELSQIANIADPKTIKRKTGDDTQMEADSSKQVFNPKTLRDKNGAYPVWLHPRKTVKNKRNKKKGKRGKKSKN